MGQTFRSFESSKNFRTPSILTMVNMLDILDILRNFTTSRGSKTLHAFKTFNRTFSRTFSRTFRRAISTAIRGTFHGVLSL